MDGDSIFFEKSYAFKGNWIEFLVRNIWQGADIATYTVYRLLRLICMTDS